VRIRRIPQAKLKKIASFPRRERSHTGTHRGGKSREHPRVKKYLLSDVQKAAEDWLIPKGRAKGAAGGKVGGNEGNASSSKSETKYRRNERKEFKKGLKPPYSSLPKRLRFRTSFRRPNGRGGSLLPRKRSEVRNAGRNVSREVGLALAAPIDGRAIGSNGKRPREGGEGNSEENQALTDAKAEPAGLQDATAKWSKSPQKRCVRGGGRESRKKMGF